VLLARSSGVHLDVKAGDSLTSGAQISGLAIPFVERYGWQSSMGVAGEGTCGFSNSTALRVDEDLRWATETAPSASATLNVGLPPNCSAPAPGYVWIATSGQGQIEGDPISGNAGGSIRYFEAVPITLVVPQAAPSPSESSTVDISEPSQTGDWRALTDAMGWTIEYPADWTAAVSGEPNKVGHVFSSGQDPAAGVVVDIWHDPSETVAPADDSTFPLSFETFGPGGDFRADGVVFEVSVVADEGRRDLTGEEVAIVKRMIESIRFEPWEVGDVRNDWMAVGTVLPASSAEWFQAVSGDGEDYFAVNIDGRRRLFGPVPPCGGETSYEVRESLVAGIECADGTGGDWDFEGRPQSGNSAGFDVALADYPAIRSWDGLLLVQFPEGHFSAS
jgi:hypothetical protein